jgi:hypothetical protein
MSDFGRRFDPSELQDGDDAAADASAADILVARDLEAFARSESVTPSVDFEDRVMAAVALEPPPRTVGGGGIAGLVAAVRDAWRLTWSGGRPFAVRAQALALVLLAAVAVGSLGAVAVVGVGRILAPNEPPVAPAPLQTPRPSMRPSPSPAVSPSVSPTPSATPTPTIDATTTPEPTQAGRPPGGLSGSGSGSGGGSEHAGSGSSDDSSGPDPDSGSDSSETQEPTQTPESGGDS